MCVCVCVCMCGCLFTCPCVFASTAACLPVRSLHPSCVFSRSWCPSTRPNNNTFSFLQIPSLFGWANIWASALLWGVLWMEISANTHMKPPKNQKKGAKQSCGKIMFFWWLYVHHGCVFFPFIFFFSHLVSIGLSESIPVEPFEPIRALGGNGKAQKGNKVDFLKCGVTGGGSRYCGCECVCVCEHTHECNQVYYCLIILSDGLKACIYVKPLLSCSAISLSAFCLCMCLNMQKCVCECVGWFLGAH